MRRLLLTLSLAVLAPCLAGCSSTRVDPPITAENVAGGVLATGALVGISMLMTK